MTVGELKKILADLENDILCLKDPGYPRDVRVLSTSEVEVCLFDGKDIFDFDESKIDPGHLQKVLVF